MSELKDLINEWNMRQTCNNQPEQNNISKAKAHVYGICVNELSGPIAKYEQAIREDERRRCAERVREKFKDTEVYAWPEVPEEKHITVQQAIDAIMEGGE